MYLHHRHCCTAAHANFKIADMGTGNGEGMVVQKLWLMP